MNSSDLKTQRYMRHEAYVNKFLGIQSTISSGRTDFDKGDGKSEKGITQFPLYVECKCTGNKSFSVTRDLLEDTSHKADYEGFPPLIAVRFYDEGLYVHGDVVILDLDDFGYIYKKTLELETRCRDLSEKLEKLQEGACA